MKYETDYLGIHERGFKKLLEKKNASWMIDPEDMRARVPIIKKSFLSVSDIKNPKTAVLGCGTGETAIGLAQEGFQVLALDISPTALEIARDKAKEAGVDIDFRTADIVKDIPVPDIFDLVVDDCCFHCIIGDDRKLFLAHALAMLKVGGVFIVRTQVGDPPANETPEFWKTWDPHTRCQVWQGISLRYFGPPDAVTQEITDAGFTVLNSNLIPGPTGWHMLELVCRKLP